MIDFKVQGYVIKKTTFKENDAILNVLTKDGIISFKGRGILKANSKNGPACNYCTLSEFVLNKKSEVSNFNLISANIVKMYSKPYDDLLTMSSYLYICNLLSQIGDNVNLFTLASECFDKLQSNVYPINVILYFIKEALDLMGYCPNIKGCINCGVKSNLVSFDLSSGGFICNKCFNPSLHEKLTVEFLKEIYAFYYNKQLYELDEIKAVKLFKMFISYLKNDVGLILNENDLIFKCL